MRKKKEPTKWEKLPEKTGWTVTAEWKQWNQEQTILKAYVNESKSKKKKPTEHRIAWKPAATLSGEKTIYFCACQSVQGDPFRGCGAVAIQIRNGALTMVANGHRLEISDI